MGVEARLRRAVREVAGVVVVGLGVKMGVSLEEVEVGTGEKVNALGVFSESVSGQKVLAGLMGEERVCEDEEGADVAGLVSDMRCCGRLRVLA